ncbi:hypothetical protein IFM61606_06656 [Aspergillus udagawae]|uniref:F-box domain-containing protein n=1 Tax=Aspergillus udagawae TaxID=91492 RepID=A0ABQ1BAK7_9EURO|nr:hypothetical protein IFM51744_08380 [Aspergillus udagawae]GFF97459.1 hypothetical protein IFM53868_09104 [Aspergillus udagawae]GFG18634.1 hypothetical protein IFM5058_09200 [Aspergillus udagawae]GFG26663.1 hypothetical protein IFM61606_06656 [Aspergillus udagawae]
MASTLPGDIIYLIVEILGQEKDFNSLFQCAVSAKCFTEQAVTAIYKSHELSPVRGGGTELGILDSTYTRRKWASMWRSIVLSALDQTYLPYYSYIRYLDLNDLSNLLSHSSFTGKIKDEFFTPELRDLVSYDYEPKGNKRLRSLRNLPDNDWILSKIGTAIIKRTTSIRGMSCDIEPSLLAEWLGELPLLQNLTIWSGVSLTDHAGDKIRTHCPDFKQITIYRWIDERGRNSETDAEEFLHGLQPHSLEYFEMLSSCHLGPRSIRAIGTQLKSLKELKLTSLGIEAIAELPSLTAAPVLEVLVLTDSTPAARNEDFYSTINRVSDWIGGCKALRHLELRRFVDDAFLLARVLVAQDIKLLSLSLTGYTMAGSRDFHRSLASQDSLQRLSLRGEGSEIPEDNELLVQAICQLHNLHELELKDISDYFTPDHLMSFAPYLPDLEKLWIGGDLFNDDVWGAFLCLPKLRSLAIHALSEFTAQGILDFISQLGPGNTGMSLSVLNSITSLTEEAQSLIRDVLRHNVDGTFDFSLAQEEFSETDTEGMSD